jgi:histidinol-phosphate aminotransferase
MFCKPFEDSILTFPPTYGMYKVVADLNAVHVKQVFLDANFQLDADEALKHVTDSTKLIFVCTPNNPSGNAIDKQQVLKLLDNFNGIVVIDEAYNDFSDEDSFTNYLDTYENLVVMQTFSKAFGLAGARLGMCFTNPNIVAYLNKTKPPYNVNTLTQQVALDKLASIDEAKNQIETILKERRRLEKDLKQISWIEKIYPSQSNFLLVKVDNANSRFKQCIAHNIVVRNRHTQPNCENCLRFTVGTPEENSVFLETICNFE